MSWVWDDSEKNRWEEITEKQRKRFEAVGESNLLHPQAKETEHTHEGLTATSWRQHCSVDEGPGCQVEDTLGGRQAMI